MSVVSAPAYWVKQRVQTCTYSVLLVKLNFNHRLRFCLYHRAGDLVLMDAGCEYHGYVSDVTRTWPVGGVFTQVQKDLYEVVRSAKEEVIEVGELGLGEGSLCYVHVTLLDVQSWCYSQLPSFISYRDPC